MYDWSVPDYRFAWHFRWIIAEPDRWILIDGKLYDIEMMQSPGGVQ